MQLSLLTRCTLGALAAVSCTAALAQTGAVPVPPRLTTYVAFAPIDDGSYNVIVLSPKQDRAIHKSQPLDFCAKDAGYATVRNVEKLPYRDEMASVLGCWESTGSADPIAAGSTVTVKFHSSANNQVRQFSLPGDQFKPMSFDWRSEKLFAPSISTR
ncbi:hypothetical protein EC845_3954 [Comamonas sp. BIGb0124]|uniref:hypothetical protein n=1 Tax=Comamonas sp. BIGb0124 TaxID=2485130 RepID=UPI000F4708E4|nr:hypothetical protein [Comamonas sp. BIGb0124]ROR18143.1 hypothetical protein EC845_3954 [Comamonas sp. BIGb0124]